MKVDSMNKCREVGVSKQLINEINPSIKRSIVTEYVSISLSGDAEHLN